MKNLIISLIAIMLLYSCSKVVETCTDPKTCCGNVAGKSLTKSSEDKVTGGIDCIFVRVVILDAKHQDRLDPQSPAYFGDRFVRGIKTFGFWDGKRQHCVAMSHISTPFNSNHYTVHLYWFKPVYEDGRYYFYTYICYPKGKEDQIKFRCKQDENGYRLYYDKIWVNDELVYDYDDLKEGQKSYYNPKYFPWMVTVFDDKGNQVAVKPDVGYDLIYITK